ncbi:metal ABC transporter permease [Gluconobacter japonicus]|uniref:ABC transporter permease n=1 Tax=Gluconobacter japonicus TaxID=376620 RepID=A0ABQ5WHC0_GLUJA|nr:metal ABC transporter permease [Gluconobacter japonicus]KXV25311.1 ABC transporter permease [Gluconobacter japonicus]KXV29861.1 ABC transporter permease [Gluconobacter japonicus]MDI6652126.1 metal ABC transporter permease [Gluconobacter japonicus]GBR23709.1 Mn2+/Zn2+ transporter permease [Gluconobacter japonicus NBRC 3271]GLQ58936.1 ABC transporter permease [Gluconobacter japonicus]
MFEFEFMQHAFLGCTIVSVLAGTVGWFLILRRQAFAAHALSHIGFSGAAGAVWLGVSPLYGMIAFSLLAGLAMGSEAKGVVLSPHRDSMIGLVLAASLGLGTWFLHEANGASSMATTLLFGDVLGIDMPTLLALTGVAVLCLSGLVFLGRPLLFASLMPDVAQARGVPVRLTSLGFMAIAALACSACAEVSGALLAFSLMVGPAATALRLGLGPIAGLVSAVALALFLSWGGLALSWMTDIPVPFWIGLGAAACYGMACLVRR